MSSTQNCIKNSSPPLKKKKSTKRMVDSDGNVFTDLIKINCIGVGAFMQNFSPFLLLLMEQRKRIDLLLKRKRKRKQNVFLSNFTEMTTMILDSVQFLVKERTLRYQVYGRINQTISGNWKPDVGKSTIDIKWMVRIWTFKLKHWKSTQL